MTIILYLNRVDRFCGWLPSRLIAFFCVLTGRSSQWVARALAVMAVGCLSLGVILAPTVLTGVTFVMGLVCARLTWRLSRVWERYMDDFEDGRIDLRMVFGLRGVGIGRCAGFGGWVSNLVPNVALLSHSVISDWTVNGALFIMTTAMYGLSMTWPRRTFKNWVKAKMEELPRPRLLRPAWG